MSSENTTELLAAMESAPGRSGSQLLATPRQSALWREARARAVAGDQKAAEYVAEMRRDALSLGMAGGGEVSVSSDGVTRTITIPAWWTREGQPEAWVDGPIGPGGQYAAVRVWPPDPQLLVSGCDLDAVEPSTTSVTKARER